MPVASSTTIFQKCLPLMRTDFGACEGLTLCDIAPTGADELDSIFRDGSSRFRIIGALLESDMMGKACQIVENPLYTFVMAYAQHWGTGVLNVNKKRGSGYVNVVPFVQVDRKGVINNNYWKLTGGTGAGGTSPNGSAWDYRCDVESLTSIPLSPDWFPIRMEVFVSGLSAGGLAIRTQYKVVDTQLITGKVRLYLQSRNSASNLPAAKLGSVTTGLLFRGVPNINPHESYCAQLPRLNTNSTYLAFVQNTRWNICNDELTQQFRQMVYENNPLYAKYYHTEEAEYNKQVTSDFQNRLVHAFFFNKALPHQNETDWDQLETINSFTDNNIGDYFYLPGVEGRCIARRAEAEGVYEQLYACGRVLDLQGDVLNWPELQDYLYSMDRLRSDNGNKSGIIEIVLDSAYKVQFIQALWRYYTGRYEGAIRANINAVPPAKKTNLGFVFTDFELDYPSGVTLRVVSHRAFDDLLSAHRAVDPTIERAGRWMLILDWSNIYMAIIESQSLDLQSGDIKDLAKFSSDARCRMAVPQQSIRHYSMMFTTVVDCPSSSLWIENFDFGVPEHENKYGNYTDVKGNDPSNDA